MNRTQWLVLAGLLTASAGTSVLMAEGDRLVNGALTAGIVAAAWFVAHTLPLSRTLRTTIATCSIIGAIVALIVYKSKEATCTAVNAADERVVIGTELTERGRKFKSDFPASDENALLESLGGLGVELAWTEESIRRCRIALAVSGGIWVPLFGVAAACAIAASSLARPARASKPARSRPCVFISYSHDDKATAVRARDLLKAHGIDVIIDADSMAPGEQITGFIRRSIADCDAVLSIISSQSLKSAWVASETIKAIGAEQAGGDGVLIAGYLDEDWLQPEFRLRCTSEIDEKLRAIEQLLPEYASRKIDPADLNEEKTRLYDLRNNLGTILARLKDSLCLDLRGSEFDESGRRMIERIRTLWQRTRT